MQQRQQQGYGQQYAPPVGQGDAYGMQPMGRTGGSSLIGSDLGPFFAEVRSRRRRPLIRGHAQATLTLLHGNLCVCP